MLFLAIILICSLTLVGAFYYSFWIVGKAEKHIFLGVTLPEEILKGEEMQNIAKEYYGKIRKCMIIMIIIGIPVHMSMAGYVSVFMILYLLWCTALYLVPDMILKKEHKKLYQMKCDNHWNAGETKTIYIDTQAVRLARKYPLSSWHFLGAVLIALLPLYASDSVKAFFSWEFSAFMFVASLVTKLAFFLLYRYFYKGSNRVYSKDTKINQKCNGIKRNVWGNCFVAVAYLDSISFVILEWGAGETQYDKYFTERFILFVIVQTIEIAMVLYSTVFAGKRIGEILKEDKQPIVVDEDEYWKDLTYNNPSDKRLMVPERVYGTNFTFNMGHPAGKPIVYGFLTVALVSMLWVSVALVRMDFVPFAMELKEESIKFTSGGYNLEVSIGDIEDVILLQELPDKRLVKINGGATDQYLLGKFRMEDFGDCYLYVYREYPVIIQIDTKERVIFFNTKDNSKTEQLYKQVCEHIGKK